MGDPTQPTTPDMWCVKFDETEYWNDAGLAEKKIGRVFGVYTFNRSQHTYCCELTPSYALYFMGSQFELTVSRDDESYDEVAEAAEEFIREVDYDAQPVTYMHVSDVDRMLEGNIGEEYALPEVGKKVIGYKLADVGWELTGLDHDEAIEAILEHYNGNGGM